MSDSHDNSGDTVSIFHAGSVEQSLIQEYTSYLRLVEEEFRWSPIASYPQSVRHAVISLYLEEKRLVATLIRDKAKEMSGGDKQSCFWGAYLYWCDALSVLAWLTSQLNHAKER